MRCIVAERMRISPMGNGALRPSAGCRLRFRSASTLVRSSSPSSRRDPLPTTPRYSRSSGRRGSSQTVSRNDSRCGEAAQSLRAPVPGDRRSLRVRVTDPSRRPARVCRQPRTASPFRRSDGRLGRLTLGPPICRRLARSFMCEPAEGNTRSTSSSSLVGV